MSLTSADRIAENIIVLSVVILEAELADVEWEILGRDLVEGADDDALNNDDVVGSPIIPSATAAARR